MLVRALVEASPPEQPFVYFGDPARPLRPGDRVIAAPAMGHQPTLADKARVLRALVDPRHRRLPLHLFFTPNRLTSGVVAALRRLSPARPILQTLTSAHGIETLTPRLRPLDRVVALSDDTARRLADAGVPAAKIRRIYPGVALPPPVDPRAIAGHRRLIYAGDLDPRVVERLVWIAAALDRPRLRGWSLTIACRPKGEGDAALRRRLQAALGGRIAGGQVELCGEVDDMPARLGRCSLQLFVADHVRRKVDLPLALLEGLARGLGLVAVGFAPLAEIFARGRDHGLTPGIAVDPAADADGWARALLEAADGAAAGRWAAAAHALVAREFSREAMARGYSALHAELGGPP